MQSRDDILNPFSNTSVTPFEADYIPEDSSRYDTQQLSVEHNEQSTQLSARQQRIERLYESKRRKTDRLNAAGLSEGDLSDTVDTERYGSVESMSNKVYNEYTPEELDYIRQTTNDKYGIFKVNGSWMKKDDQGQFVPFEGNTDEYATLYKYRTKDGNGYKIGMWGGLDSSERYSDEVLSAYAARDGKTLAPGQTWDDTVGIDRHNGLEWEMHLPAQVVALLEGLEHGSVNNVQNRLLRYQPTGDLETYRSNYRQQADQLGSGASEYYLNTELGTNPVDKEQTWREFQDRFRPESNNQLTAKERSALRRETLQRLRQVGPDNSFGGRAVNIAKGIIPGVLVPLIVQPVGSLMEMVGVDEKYTGTHETRDKFWKDAFGYDTSFSEKASAEMSDKVSKIIKDINSEEAKVDLWDFYDVVKIGITSPEIMAESLAFSASLFVPISRLTTIGKAVRPIEQRLRAKGMTKEATKAAKAELKAVKKAHTASERFTHMVAAAGPFAMVSMGETYNNFQEFKENNGGEADAGDFFRVAAITSVALGLDRMASKVLLGDTSVLREVAGAAGKIKFGKAKDAVKKTVAETTAQEYAGLYQALGKKSLAASWKVTMGTAESVAVEGTTELLQTYGEVLSQRWMSDKYGKDIVEILSDDGVQLEAWTGAAFGGVHGPAMGGIGKAGTVVAKGRQAIFGNRDPNKPERTTENRTPEERAQDENATKIAFTALREMQDRILEGKDEYTSENLAEYLEHLETVKENFYILQDGLSEEALHQTETQLKGIRRGIFEAIRDSKGEIALTKMTKEQLAGMDLENEGEALGTLMEAFSEPSQDQTSSLDAFEGASTITESTVIPTQDTEADSATSKTAADIDAHFRQTAGSIDEASKTALTTRIAKDGFVAFTSEKAKQAIDKRSDEYKYRIVKDDNGLEVYEVYDVKVGGTWHSDKNDQATEQVSPAVLESNLPGALESNRGGSTTTARIPKSSVEKVVSRVIPNGLKDGSVIVFDNKEQAFKVFPKLEQALKDNNSDTAVTEGVFFEGRTILIADQIESEAHAETVLFHESAHAGINAMLADEGVSARLVQLWDAFGGGNGFILAARRAGVWDNLKPYLRNAIKRDKNGNIILSERAKREVMLQELFAFTGENTSPTIINSIRKLVGAIRSWMRSNGFPFLSELGTTDLLYLSAKARNYGIQGTGFKEHLTRTSQPVTEGMKKAGSKSINDSKKWRKAPNGKRSKLTEKQWVQVRTKEFKDWFGDWEANPEAYEGFLDENGEPKVFYHGTDKGGFSTFNTAVRSDRHVSSTGSFFTDNEQIAQEYAGSIKNIVDYSAEDLLLSPNLVDGLEITTETDSSGTNYYEIAFNGQKAKLPNSGRKNPLGFTREQALKGLEAFKVEQGSTVTRPGVYSVFIRPKDSEAVDWKGNYWTHPPAKIKKQYGIRNHGDDSHPTNDLAEKVQKDGKGVLLIENIEDPGPHSVRDTASNVVVVFDSRDIKSADNNKGTFDDTPNVFTRIKDKPETERNYKEEVQDIVDSLDLGPEETAKVVKKQTEKERTEYTQEEKDLLVESVVELFTEYREGKLGKDEETVLRSFAKHNGTDITKLEKMILSYITVEEEATIGPRGVLTRTRILRKMLAGGDPDKGKLQKLYNDTVSFYFATATSARQLEEGIEGAEARAAALNSGAKAVGKVIYKTEYRTHRKSESKGKLFDITISKKEGRWVAHTAEAKTRLAAKQSTLSQHQTILDVFHKEAVHLLDKDTLINMTGYTIHDTTGNRAVKAEQTAYNNIIEALTKAGLTGNINKVILGHKRSKQWSPGTNRQRYNDHITNTHSSRGEAYSAQDVVLVHNVGYFKSGKQNLSDLFAKNSSHAVDLKAAIEAGATIVLDSGYNMKDKNQKDAKSRNEYFMAKQGYMRLSSFNNAERSIWVKKSPEAEEYSKKREEEKSAVKKEKNTENKLKNKLVSLEQQIRVIDLELAKEDSADKIQELEKRKTELLVKRTEAVKEVLPYFTKEKIEEEDSTQEAVDGSFSDAEGIVDTEEAASMSVEETGLSIEDLMSLEGELQPEESTTDIDLVKANLNIENTPEENVETYVNNVINRAVREAVKERRLEKAGDFVASKLPKALDALVSHAIETNSVASERASAVLEAWKEVGLRRLPKSKFIKAITDKIKDLSTGSHAEKLELGGVAEDILNNSLGSLVKGKKYFIVTTLKFDEKGNSTPSVKLHFNDVSHMQVGENYSKSKDSVEMNENGEVVQEDSTKESKKPEEIVSITEVGMDSTDLLSVKNITPLGTIPVSELDPVYREVAETTMETLQKVIRKVSKEETSGNIFDDKGKPVSSAYNLADSPARALLFDTDGKINENMAAAVGSAIRGVLTTEYRKLMLGHKDKETVARMFSIREHEVTRAHLEFASKNGTFMKSMANSLGKDILGSLGLGRKSMNEANRGEYERLVVSLGNMAIAVAQEQGLLETTTEKSNVLAKLFSNGEIRDDGPVTYFVNIPTVTRKSPTGDKRELRAGSKEVISARSEFALMAETIPDPTNSARRPFVGQPPSQDMIDLAKKNIRNDATGGQIPAEAEESIELHMKTPYELNVPAVEEFLSMYDDSKSRGGLLASLGYIPIDERNDKYSGMLYEDKLIQETKNDDIVLGIEQLRELYESIKDSSEPNINQIYFNYFYSTNHRFSIDSTTINPQSNKQLHRFFVTPKAQQVTYTFDGKTNTFSYEYTLANGTKGTIDSSLYVRAALAQAFGVGVDKAPTVGDSKGQTIQLADGIIPTGNAILSMNRESIEAARKELYKHGKFTLIAGDGSKKEFKPDHFAHAIQALDFLTSVQDAKDTDSNQITSNLTVETDALTSGFSNKVQQFGVIGKPGDGGFTSHADRVALIQNESDQAANFKSETFGVNDMLASGTLDDSYQNLAKAVLTSVKTLVKELDTTDAKLFDALSGLIPGGDQLVGNTSELIVDKALRDLFKYPFMIFNYAGSVGTIVNNLGQDMAKSALEKIAASNLQEGTEDFNAEAHAAALRLAAVVIDPKDGTKPIKDPIKLQELLKSVPLSQIRTSVNKKNASNQPIKGSKLDLTSYISTSIIDPTYGEAVKKAFDAEFETFIEIQNTTNDVFKQSFSLFHHALHTRMKDFRKDLFDDNGNLVRKGAQVVTEKDLLRMIEELIEVFPVIAGPLSQALKEGIYIHETSTGTADGVMSTVTTSQDKFNKSNKVGASRKVNNLLRNLTSAVNSGAVLPLHAIDGAQLATAVNTFADFFKDSDLLDNAGNPVLDAEGNKVTLGTGLIPIHDAVTVPLPFMDIFARIYNQNTINLNQQYSIFDEMKKLNERMQAFMDKGAELDVTDPDGQIRRITIKVNPDTVKAIEGLSVSRSDETLKEAIKFIKDNKPTLKLSKESKSALEARVKKLKEEKESDRSKITEAEKSLENLSNLISDLETAIAQKEALLSFSSLFAANTTRVVQLVELVEKSREDIYANGTSMGVMVALAGSVAKVENDPRTGVTPRAQADELVIDRSTAYLSHFQDSEAYETMEVSVDTTPDTEGQTPAKTKKTPSTVKEKVEASAGSEASTVVNMPNRASDRVRMDVSDSMWGLYVEGTAMERAFNKLEKRFKKDGKSIIYPAIQDSLTDPSTMTETQIATFEEDSSTFVTQLTAALKDGATVLFDTDTIESDQVSLEKAIFGEVSNSLGHMLKLEVVESSIGGETIFTTLVSADTKAKAVKKMGKKPVKGSLGTAKTVIDGTSSYGTKAADKVEYFHNLCL